MQIPLKCKIQPSPILSGAQHSIFLSNCIKILNFQPDETFKPPVCTTSSHHITNGIDTGTNSKQVRFHHIISFRLNRRSNRLQKSKEEKLKNYGWDQIRSIELYYPYYEYSCCFLQFKKSVMSVTIVPPPTTQ